MLNKIDKNERNLALDILTRSNITEAEKLVNALEDGVVFDFELPMNETLLDEEGIEFKFRRPGTIVFGCRSYQRTDILGIRLQNG